MNKNGIYAAFTAHRDFATKKRGLKFLFTFEEWVAWWVDHLGPDWFAKRGRAYNQYVMARIGDKGPYAIWNVECITSQENHRRQVENGTSNYGEKNGTSKLTEEQVIEIFYSKEDRKKLAARLGITTTPIYQIKTGRTWRHLTRKLK
jgi:hypothetical protein